MVDYLPCSSKPLWWGSISFVCAKIPPRIYIVQFQQGSSTQHEQLRNAYKPPATPYRPECETLYASASMSYRAPPPALHPPTLQQARVYTASSNNNIINVNLALHRQQLQAQKPTQHTYLGITRAHITQRHHHANVCLAHRSLY